MWREQEKEIKAFCEKLKTEFPNLYGAVPNGICKGWHPIIYKLSEDLNEIIERLPAENRPKVIQMKEKFGGLKCYLEFENKEMSDLIKKAEQKSFDTCEWCGVRGYQFVHNWWIKTLCESCHEKRKTRGE